MPRHAVDADSVSPRGHAADVIASLADSGSFDLLMMDSHGHGNLVMGSVAAKVLACCKVPDLLVR